MSFGTHDLSSLGYFRVIKLNVMMLVLISFSVSHLSLEIDNMECKTMLVNMAVWPQASW